MHNNFRVSVIVPALNEAKNLPHVLPLIPSWVSEIILVDGHSTDDTIAVAQEIIPDIRVIYQEGKGKGAALRSGFAAATGDIIVMIDADGSTDPREIPAFVGALLAGADFVKGSRFMQGGGSADLTPFRVAGHWGLLQMVNTLFGSKYTDLCYGYSAFWRDILDPLALDTDGFEIETLMNIRALRIDARVVEVPSFEHERLHGVGNLRAIPDGWRVLKTILRERFVVAHEARLAKSDKPVPRLAVMDEQQGPQMKGINARPFIGVVNGHNERSMNPAVEV